MITLIKNARIISAFKEEKRDILFGDRIISVDKKIDLPLKGLKVIDAEGRSVTPGLIDQHTHLIGAGGKYGFASLTPEIMLSDLIRCGTTTVVGTLGTDGTVKSVKSLYAKTKALEIEGISAYMFTNYFGFPVITICDNVQDDLVFIDKVIGCKLALSDERCSFPEKQDVLGLLRQVRVGGLVSGKTGILHVHLGTLNTGMDMLINIVKQHQFPIHHISPTHVGRTEKLFDQSLEFAGLGGIIDITTGASKFIEPYEQVIMAMKKGVSIDNMTFSSDGNAGLSILDEKGGFIGVRKAPLDQNLIQVIKLIGTGKVSTSDAFKLITVNPAKNLGLKNKGKIEEGYDADLVFFDENFEISDVIAKGQIFMENKVIIKKGYYES